ncbi:hypothetical protein D917_05609 [Trichinella nativa]|uniref:Tyrosine specific protein phosphatases domain-containing protein n=1 Tax=Trichinella nativa TaxID=6335 RepID=A0A1Y3EZJ6_9BILA|nr:hypothetical protein D917_05609 [Trichinella nativa]
MSTDGRRSQVWNSFRRKKSESMDKGRRRLDNNGTYGTVRETLLRLVPRNSLCRMFCHGSKCKYCNPDLVPDNMKIIDGIYSTWITEDILAIARPSDEGIERFQLIEQLAKCGVKSIFNLQLPFEHAHCGNPLTEHGFSYDPEIFMEHGSSIAVHCHAGLGRTGTLICCFLIWNRAWTAEQALQHTRLGAKCESTVAGGKFPSVRRIVEARF